MRKIGYYAAGIMVFALLAGCAKTPSADTEVADLLFFPQDSQSYVANTEGYTSLLPLQSEYDRHYFQPWNYTKPPFELEQILWPFGSYTYGKNYGENLQLIQEEWFVKMQEEGNYEAYGALGKRAVSLNYLHLRNFPTHKPVFKDPKQAGEGFPFDYMQNSGIHANEPLYVSHLSKNGKWAYVFTAYATGWVPLKEIAYIETEVARDWQNAQQIGLLSDEYNIKDVQGNFVFRSRVGMQLALISVQEDHYVALAITAGRDHSASYNQVIIPKELAHREKLLLNQENLSRIMDEMMRSNYGWGGLYEERDCSSMLRDLYAPFGLWLPRNSGQQAKIGRIISFEGLSIDQKRQKIKEEGVPFETLLYKQGHILLYLGTYEGKIAVLHNVWGIRTLYKGVSGRKVIGRTIVSSLDLGSERKDYNEDSSLASTLLSMNIITQQ